MAVIGEFGVVLGLSVLSMSFTFLIYNLFDDINDWMRKNWVYVSVIYLIMFVINYYYDFMMISILEFLFSFFILIAGFKGKRMNKAFIIIYMLTVTYCLEVSYQIIYSVITKKSYSYLLNNEYKYTVHIALFHLSVVLTYYFIHFRVFYGKKIRLESVKKKVIIASVLILIPLTFYLIKARYYFVDIGHIDFGIQSSFLVASIIIVMVLIFFVLLSIQMRTLKEQQEYNNNLLKSMLKNKGEHYKQIENLNRDIRKNNHDMYNQLITIELLLNKNDVRKAQDYISTMKYNVSATKNLIESGNEIFDAILNEKISVANDKGIKIQFNGMMPSDDFIDYLDICSICANSIDNAIEATSKEHNCETVIHIESKVKNNHWIYNISNPTDDLLIYKGDKLVSSKMNKAFHGFGLENIKDSVYKYGGKIEMKNENHKFFLKVIIKINS